MRRPWWGTQARGPDYGSVDDATLLGEARHDPQAFAAFYDRHASAVLTYFARRTSDAETAADLTAETFASALDGLERYDAERGVPAAWLYGIAHHQLSRWLRRQASDLRVRGRAAVGPIALDEVSASRIESLIDAERARVWLEPALDQLSPLLRQAVELRIVADLPYTEVARQSGCSVSVARVRVCRALSQLSDSATLAAADATSPLVERSA